MAARSLDLHIHDTDFVQFCFGMPKAVTSFGYSKITNQPDHVFTHYHYDDVPLVVAEGSWAMADGFSFNMQFTVNFEQATAVYDLQTPHPLMLYQKGHPPQAVPVENTMGYDLEIDYFLKCIQSGKRSIVVTTGRCCANGQDHRSGSAECPIGRDILVGVSRCGAMSFAAVP